MYLSIPKAARTTYRFLKSTKHSDTFSRSSFFPLLSFPKDMQYLENSFVKDHSHVTSKKKGTEKNLGHNSSTISFNLSKLGSIWKCTNQKSAIRVPIRLKLCSHFHSTRPQNPTLGIHKA